MWHQVTTSEYAIQQCPMGQAVQAVVGELELQIKFVPFLSSSPGSFKRDHDKVPDRWAH